MKITPDAFNLQGMKRLYPELFLDCFDFSPPSGWLQVLAPLIETFARDPTCRVVQVKCKFGGLRLYLATYTDSQSRLIREAEKACFRLCEQCGTSEGVETVSQRGWQRRVCGGCSR